MEDNNKRKIIVSSMNVSRGIDWTRSVNKKNKRMRPDRYQVILSASFVLLAVACVVIGRGMDTQTVMGQMSSGFEYDESLGRLQFVSNILPESAMVFLQTDQKSDLFCRPVTGEQRHVWSEEEPWIEYNSIGEAVSSADGEVMSVVSSRAGEYTVRILHDDGYESIYSGLCDVQTEAGSKVKAGDQIGMGAGVIAYEMRKDGLSIQPVFAETEGMMDAN